MGKSSEVQKLLRELRRQGFETTMTKGGHYRVTKGEHMVHMPATPSDFRSMKNTLSHLRKAGFQHGKRKPKNTARRTS